MTSTQLCKEEKILYIQLLGDFRLANGHQPLTSINAGRLQSLLAYLLLHREAPQSRQYLSFLYWPDQPEGQARNNLRQALHQLRHSIPDSDRYIKISASTVQWSPEDSFSLDVIEFEEALGIASLAERSGNLSTLQSALEKALTLYRGDLLPSCYDDWLLSERERLHQRCLEALERMVALLERQRAYETAIPFAQRLLRHDPLYEKGYQMLMRLYALNDDRANALRTYRACTDILARELGIEPEPATEEMYQRLLTLQESYLTPELVSMPPLVGRSSEWYQVMSAWKGAAAGKPHCVLISGEAGIGKSRLAEELLEWAAHQGFSTAKTRAYAAEGRLSYGPLIDWLRSQAVRTGMSHMDKIWLIEISRLLPELLVEYPDLPSPEPLREDWQRQRFFQALANATLAARQPLLLVIDDLQWCDPDTLEWLHYLLRVDSHARILVVGTLRSEEVISNPALQKLLLDLRQAGYITEIELGPLDAAETARLGGYAVDQEIDIDTALRLFHETEGNPLFILETMQAGFLDSSLDLGSFDQNNLEPEQKTAEALHLPPKVQAVIAARLAQCSTNARELASLSAIVGRAFSFEILAKASDTDNELLALGLDELWQRRIVHMLDENNYDFTHDKIREVAYSEVSPQRRRLLHRRVAHALETAYSAGLDGFHAQIAIHYVQAGAIEQAIPHYYQSALVSLRMGASTGATSLLQKGLELLQTIPESPERDAQELELQTLLGVALVDRRGHGAPEILQTYEQVQSLSRRLGRPLTPPVLRALAVANVVQANFKQALDYSEQLLELAETEQDSVLTVEGCYVAGVTRFWLGDFLRSREYLERAIDFYQPDQSRLHISLYAQDPQVICLSRLAFTLWCLGYPAKSVEVSQAALACAVERGHRFSATYARAWDTRLHLFLRNASLTEQKATELAVFCREHQDQFWLQEAEAMLGWVQAEHGEAEAGIASIRAAMDASEALGMLMERPFFLVLQASLHGQSGDLDRGLRLLDEALEFIEKTEGRWCEVEVYRCQGELFESKGETEIAEAAFRRAMETACQQSARMLELRAATALARMWVKRGKGKQAREILAPVYDWFSEGFDTPDLQDARRLLAEIEPNSAI